jgi:hypothetical protein
MKDFRRLKWQSSKHKALGSNLSTAKKMRSKKKSLVTGPQMIFIMN